MTNINDQVESILGASNETEALQKMAELFLEIAPDYWQIKDFSFSDTPGWLLAYICNSRFLKVRLLAAKLMAGIPSFDVTAKYLELLNDPSVNVCKLAIKELGSRAVNNTHVDQALKEIIDNPKKGRLSAKRIEPMIVNRALWRRELMRSG